MTKATFINDEAQAVSSAQCSGTIAAQWSVVAAVDCTTLCPTLSVYLAGCHCALFLRCQPVQSGTEVALADSASAKRFVAL